MGEEGVISLPKKRKIQIQVSPDDRLHFPSHVGLRDEEFGGIIFTGNGGFVLLDDKTYLVVKDIFAADSFTAK